MIIDTKIIDDFLTDSEIELFESRIASLPKKLDEDHSSEKLWKSELQIFVKENRYSDSIVKSIIDPKIKKYFPENMIINQGHVLTSYIPYGIHTDARASFGVPSDTHKAAWTFVIPLDSYDSATLVFDQYGTETIYEPMDCAEEFNWTNDKKIDPDIVSKYLSNQPQSLLRWFTVQNIFDWKKGTNFAAPRVNFHCSDDFPSKGIPFKRAIIMWTTVPKN